MPVTAGAAADAIVWVPMSSVTAKTASGRISGLIVDLRLLLFVDMGSPGPAIAPAELIYGLSKHGIRPEHSQQWRFGDYA